LRLQVDNLEFNYKDNNVLCNVNFCIDQPGIYCIIGPNGVGKTTLLQCIDRQLIPTKGSILIDNQNIFKMGRNDFSKIVGYVPQITFESFPTKVVDSVLLGRYPYSKYGYDKNDLDITLEALSDMGILDYSNCYTNELSTGQLQKVQIARGIVQQTRILLLDEPTSNLDVKHQISVFKSLKQLASIRKMVIIVVCHDINLAATYSDKLIVMCGGSIYAYGSPSDIITNNLMKNVYGIDCYVQSYNDKPYILYYE